MSAAIYWIETPPPGKTAILSRPRGGDWLAKDIQEWRRLGVNIVVSALTEDDCRDLELTEEASICESAGIGFVSIPIVDFGVPEISREFTASMDDLAANLRQGKSVGFHCRAGIGRSVTLAAAVLTKIGLDPETAVHRLAKARGLQVPETSEQRKWIELYARPAIT